MIPKFIYQTYPAINLPDVLFKNALNIKIANPGWDYHLYTNEEMEAFVQEGAWPELLEQYNRLQTPITRVDVFKYLLMYRMGGVYLDIKSTIGSLDTVLSNEDTFILSQWKDPATQFKTYLPDYMQWFVIAAPGHPYMKAVLDRIVNKIKDFKGGYSKQDVWALTGPRVYTEAIEPIRHAHPHKFVDAENLGLKYSVLNNWHGHYDFFHPHYSHNRQELVK